MDYKSLTEEMTRFLMEDSCNYIQPDDAMEEEYIGMRIFDAPEFRVAAADDPMFAKLRDEEAIGSIFMPPQQWLEGAVSVISFFLPISERTRLANEQSGRTRSMPADEWLHCRIEGQEANRKFASRLCRLLEESGYRTVAPSVDARLVEDITSFKANWSERHAAFIGGLGTFGLSRGLITARGMAGRLGSVITDFEITPDTRDYGGIYDYCIMCGICADNCPGGAIDKSLPPDKAKSHLKCSQFHDLIKSQPPRGKSQKKRFGCGLCQVGVPCEAKRP